MLRIRDVYPGSKFFHAGSASKNLSITRVKPKKLFLSSRKYDPSCSSPIRIFYTSRIYGVKKAPGSRIRNTGKTTGKRHGPLPVYILWYIFLVVYRDCKDAASASTHHTLPAPCISSLHRQTDKLSPLFALKDPSLQMD